MIYLQFSRQCLMLFTVLYGWAIGAVCRLSLEWPLKLSLILLLLGGWGYVLRLHIWRNAATAICGITLFSKGQGRLMQRDGACYHAVLRDDSVVSRFISILNFSIPHSRRKVTVLLFPDMLQPAEFRQMRVKIKDR